MKPNREQIIKALECCGGEVIHCRDCGYGGVGACQEKAAKDAIALIKELTEENEKLTSLCTSKDIIIADQNKDYIALDMELRTVNTENKRLTEENEELYRLLDDKIQECKKRQGRLKIECEYTEKNTVRKIMHLVRERAENAEIIIESSIRPIGVMYQISNTELEKIEKEILNGKEIQ